MKRFKSFSFKLAIIFAVGIWFVGCGSDDSANDASNEDNVTIIEEVNIIDDYYSFSTKITEIQEIEVKSEYETIETHNARVSNYIEEQGIVYFDISLYDSYDVETKTLYIYGFSDYYPNEHSFSMGTYNGQYIDVDNFDLFPIVVKKLPETAGSIYDPEQSVFTEYTVNPEVAQELDGDYRILIGIKFKVDNVLYKDDGIANVYNTDILGMVYRINSELVSFKIYNSQDKNNIIKEFTLDIE